MLLLLEAQEGNWEEIDAMVRTFQTDHFRDLVTPMSGHRRRGQE